MQDLISALLSAHGISACAPISLRDCSLARPYLLEREGIKDGTAFLFVVPYYTTFCDDPARNISAYAVSRDYHLFFAQLFDAILPTLRTAFPQNCFVGFSDHSPIVEVEAAAKAGLGQIGCNGLLLTKRHSSYVFLGEIITDAVIDAPVHEPSLCAACRACTAACPVELRKAECLSALTQKKGTLQEAESFLLRKHGLAWGCDRCQTACPVTKQARANGTLYTSIDFFKKAPLPHVTAMDIEAMDDAAFRERAYSWRGRAAILRNLDILEKGNER